MAWTKWLTHCPWPSHSRIADMYLSIKHYVRTHGYCWVHLVDSTLTTKTPYNAPQCAVMRRSLYPLLSRNKSFLAKRDYVTFVCLSSVVSVVCDVRATYSGGLTFRGYFEPYFSLAIRQLTHQKSRRSSKGITPSEQISLTGVCCATPLR